MGLVPCEKVGKWTEWHENGKKVSEGKYKDDAKVGKWTYYENGKKRAKE